MRKALVIEDDQIIAVALREGLQTEGYLVEIAGDGAAGLSAASAREFDIVILDVMLPCQSGFDVCRRLRRAGNTVPIIMLTARDLEAEKVQGLRIGADDYLTKPFSLMELFARIEAVLRRASRDFEALVHYEFGGIRLDFKKLEATRRDAPLELSPREFKILRYFIEHRGEVVSRDQLLNNVWAYNCFPTTRTVDQHIARLRQKIEPAPAEPQFLITVHGAGYKFLG
ncbi:MAG: response regulator transcription factor [Blastocatellia bacterium]